MRTEGVIGFARRWLIEPLKSPTGKQKEAYARFVHTLSAACFIGTVTIGWGGSGWKDALRASSLFLLGVVLFFVAALLAKGSDGVDR